MKYYFYVLYSLKDGRLYKGVSKEVGVRYLKHCMGGVTSTRNRRPLVLIYVQWFDSKTLAMEYERQVKGVEGGAELRKKLNEMGILDIEGKLNISREKDQDS